MSGDDYRVMRHWMNGGALTGFLGDQMEVEVRSALNEIERLRGIQRAVVALARTVLGKSEHPVERSPWIDVIHMMDEEARTNGSAGATHVGAQP